MFGKYAREEEAFILAESQGEDQWRYLSSKIVDFLSNQISDGVALTVLNMLIHNKWDFEDKEGTVINWATLYLTNEKKGHNSLKLYKTPAQQLSEKEQSKNTWNTLPLPENTRGPTKVEDKNKTSFAEVLPLCSDFQKA